MLWLETEYLGFTDPLLEIHESSWGFTHAGLSRAYRKPKKVSENHATKHAFASEATWEIVFKGFTKFFTLPE